MGSLQIPGIRCDEKGEVAICDICGQLFSPYWTARKSAGMHRGVGAGHRVRVMPASKALALLEVD